MKKLVFKLCAFLILLGVVFPAPAAFAAEVDSGAEDGAKWEYVEAEGKTLIHHTAVPQNGLIYIIGGTEKNVFSNRTIVYDPKTNEFHDAPGKSVKSYIFSSVVYRGKIYCFGGSSDKGQRIDTVEIFDPKTETWSVADTVLPVEKYGSGAVVVGDKIYIIGGIDKNDNGQCTVDIYNPQTNTWDTGAAIPYPPIYFGCTVLQNKIYVFGGTDESGNINNQSSNQVFCYDPAVDAWTQAGTLPKGLWGLSVSSYNDKAVIIGGMLDSSSNSSDNTYIYDPISQSCTEGPKLNTSRFAHASTIVGDIVYVLYGRHIENDATEYTTKIEKLNLSQLIPAPPASDNLTVLLNTEETIQLSVSNNLADNADLTWTSTDSSVAQVDENGKVTAITPGECSISVETAGDAYREVIPVKVFDGDADQYRLAVNLQPAQTAKLHLTQDPASTVWTSHDTTVATVNSSGRVTAVANGLVIIDGEANSQNHHIYVRVRA